MGDKRLSQSSGREVLQKVFRMKVFVVPSGLGVKRRVHRFRDGCGRCLSIVGALVQPDSNVHG